MAKWLGLPVLLVVDARAMARSAGALVLGFASFDPGLPLTGVVFNRLGGATHLKYLKQALGRLDNLKCFGGLPRDQELAIPERHLGLVTAGDHPLNADYLGRLADLVEAHLDLDGLLRVLPKLEVLEEPPGAPRPAAVRLGVAQDRAFCFYYPENLEWLAHYGAELVPFSPLKDPHLPEALHGLYLGGGYPELFARQLAENQAMRRAIREQGEAGLPIYAECGGLMYLSEEILEVEGRSHPMVGLLPLKVRMLPRLKSLGYREITLGADSLIGPAGTRARGHEFHYSEIVSEPVDLHRHYRVTPRQAGEPGPEGYGYKNILASYVHLHFGSNPQVARHLVAGCRRFMRSLKKSV
jgi:cobyrinic acid a,c-diamide synthase